MGRTGEPFLKQSRAFQKKWAIKNDKTDKRRAVEMGISIIIPTYNGGRVFSKCLEMIEWQDYGGKVQLIVVDSGSTDGTVASAEREAPL